MAQKLVTLSALAVAMFASPASADITAEDFWAAYQTYMSATDINFSASEERTETGIILHDLTATSFVTGETFSFADAILTNQDDGTVHIEWHYRESPLFDFYEIESASLSSENFIGIASGDPDNLVLENTADRITVEMTIIEGPSFPPIDAQFVVTDVQMREIIDLRDPEHIVGNMSGSSSHLELSGASAQPPEYDQMPIVFAVSIDQPSFSAFLSPIGASFGGNPERVDDNAFIDEMEMAVSYESLDFNYSSRNILGPVEIRILNAAGGMMFDISDASMNFDLGVDETQVLLGLPDLPFPMLFDVNRIDLGMSSLLPGTTFSEPLSFQFHLSELTTTESVWDHVDPGGHIDRSPISFLVDTDMLIDNLIMLATSSPELQSLTTPRHITINEFAFDGGGASYALRGGLDFLGTLPDLIPVGQLDLQLTGANALISSFLEAGLIAPANALMARGMIAMATLPTDTPDSYTSEFVFSADGGVSANGIPLQ